MARPGSHHVVDPGVGVGPALPRKDPDRRAARLLRAARSRLHHLAQAPADDHATTRREQAADLLRLATHSAPLPITAICTAR